MNLKKIQNTFHQELKAIYPKEEIDSFFYMLIDEYYNVSRIQLAINSEISIDNVEVVLNALQLLKKEKPIQYILGKTEFYGLNFKVNDNVLIPRPETEELVDWVLNKTPKTQNPNILDIGTGSGCIAISLAKHLPNAKVYALDISEKALQVAGNNADLNAVNINFIEADILMTSSLKDFKFDIIVSNPPYVRETEKQLMTANVLDNEPHLALFVKDEDPLIFYRAITEFAINNLTKNGKLFFEINEYLGKDMIQLLKKHNFTDIELKQDSFKKDRMIKASLNR